MQSVTKRYFIVMIQRTSFEGKAIVCSGRNKVSKRVFLFLDPGDAAKNWFVISRSDNRPTTSNHLYPLQKVPFLLFKTTYFLI